MKGHEIPEQYLDGDAQLLADVAATGRRRRPRTPMTGLMARCLTDEATIIWHV
ncbi:hypothetical protein JHN63_21765 [Streptomyces sp. MBT65]|uniref:hypothetical protein n=1 Tax=Streptomyces sp. MBT65 TaxID=1488395 RepID=UPI00190B5AC0|nr:hypothetical protein [Streptomyces sp. MBT65]MBK3576394.1 hypothetical protein [Streptomyces sp. MBT65]